MFFWLNIFVSEWHLFALKVKILHEIFYTFKERRSNRQTVTLLRLNLKSAGAYKCEISAEAPLFDTVSRICRLSVIVLPNSQPRISGAKHTYHVGERVSVNCTSDRSKPAASLRWYINDMEVSKN